MRSSGRTTPSSSAAAARITLKVEPGSKGSVTTRSRQLSLDGTSRKVFGLNVGRIARASTSPVRGSRTTAIADLAPVPVGGVELPLGHVLNRPIEREHDAEAGLGRLEHVRRGDLPAERVAADDRLAGGARELAVEGPLDALEPALHALEPDDVRRQLAVRVEAERCGQEAKA